MKSAVITSGEHWLTINTIAYLRGSITPIEPVTYKDGSQGVKISSSINPIVIAVEGSTIDGDSVGSQTELISFLRDFAYANGGGDIPADAVTQEEFQARNAEVDDRIDEVAAINGAAPYPITGLALPQTPGSTDLPDRASAVIYGDTAGRTYTQTGGSAITVGANKARSITYNKTTNLWTAGQEFSSANVGINSVSTSSVQDNAITPEKTSFFEKNASSNLFNPDDPDFADGFILSSSTGLPSPNASWATTGFIPVEELLPFYLGNNGVRFNARFAHSYNDQKVRIRGGEDQQREFFTVDENDKYVRFSFNKSNTLFQVNQGSIKAYEPFSEEYLIKEEFIPKQTLEIVKSSADSIRGQDALINKIANAAANTTYPFTGFPYHLKKGITLSLSCNFTTFGGVTVGMGYQQFRGFYFEITSTNIIQKTFGATESIVSTTPHGLTIEDFIRFSFSINNNGVATVVLFSKGGQFKTTLTTSYEYNYASFVRVGSSAMTDVVLTLGSTDFRHSVWAFGDSYFGVTPNRWIGVMKNIGYFNFLVNGLAGQGSGNGFIDLERSLLYGTPKYLLWFLGMNDLDATYISNVERVSQLCSSKGIELILATIPTVPTRNKEVISQYVRGSGFRFVDFYKAVGANSSGLWYPGYLDTSEAEAVHPTALGAQALANRVLIDFPELMQYGLI